MIARLSVLTMPETFAELQERLGDVPGHRVMLNPYPGTATEEDVIEALSRPRKRICELVDGVLVDKDVSTKEALLAGEILGEIRTFIRLDDLGKVFPGDALMRLRPGLVRAPDVSFVPWDRMPGDEVTDEPIASFVPTLAVEVVTKNNSPREIDRKIYEYFDSGVRLVWVIDPASTSARIYTAVTRIKTLGLSGVLDGGKVLPGFKLPLADLFAATKRRKKKTKKPPTW